MFPKTFEKTIYIFMRKSKTNFKSATLKPVKKYENSRYIEIMLERLKK